MSKDIVSAAGEHCAGHSHGDSTSTRIPSGGDGNPMARHPLTLQVKMEAWRGSGRSLERRSKMVKLSNITRKTALATNLGAGVMRATAGLLAPAAGHAQL